MYINVNKNNKQIIRIIIICIVIKVNIYILNSLVIVILFKRKFRD